MLSRVMKIFQIDCGDGCNNSVKILKTTDPYTGSGYIVRCLNNISIKLLLFKKQTTKKKQTGTFLSGPVAKTLLLMQRAWVPSLVRELRPSAAR